MLTLAALGGLAMTLLTFAIVGRATGGPPTTPEDLLPILLAAACLCVAGLAHRRAPSIAWLAVIGALTIATLDVAAWGRVNRATLDPVAWRWLTALV